MRNGKRSDVTRAPAENGLRLALTLITQVTPLPATELGSGLVGGPVSLQQLHGAAEVVHFQCALDAIHVGGIGATLRLLAQPKLVGPRLLRLLPRPIDTQGCHR